MIWDLQVVENTGRDLFVQESLEVLYLLFIVGEKNRELLEFRDPSVSGDLEHSHFSC